MGKDYIRRASVRVSAIMNGLIRLSQRRLLSEGSESVLFIDVSLEYE